MDKLLKESAHTDALQVLDAVMQYSDRNAGEESEQLGQQVEVLHWAAAIDDTGRSCFVGTRTAPALQIHWIVSSL